MFLKITYHLYKVVSNSKFLCICYRFIVHESHDLQQVGGKADEKPFSFCTYRWRKCCGRGSNSFRGKGEMKILNHQPKQLYIIAICGSNLAAGEYTFLTIKQTAPFLMRRKLFIWGKDMRISKNRAIHVNLHLKKWCSVIVVSSTLQIKKITSYQLKESYGHDTVGILDRQQAGS